MVLQRKGSDAKEQDANEKPRRNVSWQDKGWSSDLLGDDYLLMKLFCDT